MGLSHLDRWLVLRMGWPDAQSPPLPEQLRAWQLERLREIVAHARANSPFYASHFKDVDPSAISSFEDFSRLPTIAPQTVREEPEQLLCVSQDEIARVVTLNSSGTTGQPKRVFHAADDLEATADYFDRGMRNLVEPGQTVLILMPGERPGGVGRLLVEAVARSGARAVCHGIMEDADRAVEHVLGEGASCVVGPANHVNLLASRWKQRGLPADVIRSVLLCWDAAPDAVVRRCERILGCRVFRHWGMIETGLGGAVECAPGSGMHLREADLYLEIVDPETGRLLPDGERGEMVVTMLRKFSMPLIRYRTGDAGCILPGGCGCGSPMRRLGLHVHRLGIGVGIGSGAIRIEDVNEALFSVGGVGDFVARVSGGVFHVFVVGPARSGEVEEALVSLPVVERALAGGEIRIEVETRNDAVLARAGLGKRRILIHTE